MRYFNTDSEEGKTMKPRCFEIYLSDKDVELLYKKAYSNGITPEDLIEVYVNDVIDGANANGDNIKWKAREYFDSCCFRFLTKSLINWAVYNGREKELEHAISKLDVAKGKLQDLESLNADHSYDNNKEYEAELHIWQEQKENAEDLIDRMIIDYEGCEEVDMSNADDYEIALSEARKYYEDLRSMKEKGFRNSCSLSTRVTY